MAIATIVALTGGCAVRPCNEFAAPLDRAARTCPPSKVAALPPPPGEPDQHEPRYCYGTLGQVDCFTAPVPGRTNYLGSYDPAAPSAVPAPGLSLPLP